MRKKISKIKKDIEESLSEENTTKWILNLSNARLLLLILCMGSIIIGLVTLFVDSIFTQYEFQRPDNLHAIVIEIGVGALIAIIVYVISIQQSNQIESILKKQEKREQNWKIEWGKSIIEQLRALKELHLILERWIVDYLNNDSTQNKDSLIGSAQRLAPIADFHAQRIQQDVPKIENLFNDAKLASNLIGFGSQFSACFKNMHVDFVWEKGGLDNQIQFIDGIIKAINNYLERLEKEIPNTSKSDS